MIGSLFAVLESYNCMQFGICMFCYCLQPCNRKRKQTYAEDDLGRVYSTRKTHIADREKVIDNLEKTIKNLEQKNHLLEIKKEALELQVCNANAERRVAAKDKQTIKELRCENEVYRNLIDHATGEAKKNYEMLTEMNIKYTTLQDESSTKILDQSITHKKTVDTLMEELINTQRLLQEEIQKRQQLQIDLLELQAKYNKKP